MRFDPKTLPQRYQAQIVAQLKENKREKALSVAQEPPQKSGKYHNIHDQRNGTEGRLIRFDSKKEARRFDELSVMLRAGKIRNLKLQPQFTLQEAYTTEEGVRVRAIRYQADFSYERHIPHMALDEWRLVVEDVKSRATKTPVYAMKKKLMRERLGIEITEVE